MATTPQLNLAEPYAMPVDIVLLELQATAEGLSTAEAESRLAAVGANRLPEAPRDPAWKRFLRHFDDVLIYILLGSAVLKAFIGEWIDFAVILGVAVINSLVGFIQEGRAESALEGIRKMLSATAEVRRDGEWQKLDAEQLVPGDVIRLRSGDRVPADLRLLEATSVRAEEAALTGEAEPSNKNVRMVESGAGVGDRSSMMFSSSIVVSGQALGVVTATGQQAEIGRIQKMLSEVDSFDTPLTRQMTAFGKSISVVILVMAAVMVFIGRVIHDFAFNDLVSATIGFAVAAIPEGLPALVTITLALGVQQMAKRKAIIRRLPAVETLGSVTVICSDKTGTLTKNEMTAREVFTAAGSYHVEGIGYSPEGGITHEGARAELARHRELADLIKVIAVANDADVVPSTDHPGAWALVGEPTEGALRTLGLKAGFDHKGYTRVAVVPFESENKLMAVLAGLPAGGQQVLLKGAPDRLLQRSENQQVPGGGTEPLDHDFWERQIDALSGQGLRVLAAAIRNAPAEAENLTLEDLADGFTFVGLVGIVDPPRPEAIQAIATSQRAGIRVKMITGDHAGTASAISREMGITTADSAPAITGAQLEAATDEELRAIVNKTDTFARTSPEHKLRLVQALQANGEVVSMTGDGVNDAPALKRADIGVAMGIKGTEATKEAAAVVLADDNFATIEHAVEEGRRIYDNLQKSIIFLLPTNGAQSLVILVAVLLGLTLPLAPVQILWVNMVTAVTLSLALAYEPAESDVMTRPPRQPGGSLLDTRFLPRIALASVLIAGATLLIFQVARNDGLDTATSQTMAVNTLVLAQCAFLFNSRYLRESSFRRGIFTDNPVSWIVVGVLIALQVMFVYLPFMHTWFHSAPVGWQGWLLPLGLAVLVFLLIEAGKIALRSRETRVR